VATFDFCVASNLKLLTDEIKGIFLFNSHHTIEMLDEFGMLSHFVVLNL